MADFCAYMLSFLYIGIYWNNHHHLFYAIAKVNGAILWANMNLLFWLSLLPFTTAYMSENYFAAVPVGLLASRCLRRRLPIMFWP